MDIPAINDIVEKVVIKVICVFNCLIKVLTLFLDDVEMVNKIQIP